MGLNKLVQNNDLLEVKCRGVLSPQEAHLDNLRILGVGFSSGVDSNWVNSQETISRKLLGLNSYVNPICVDPTDAHLDNMRMLGLKFTPSYIMGRVKQIFSNYKH